MEKIIKFGKPDERKAAEDKKSDRDFVEGVLIELGRRHGFSEENWQRYVDQEDYGFGRFFLSETLGRIRDTGNYDEPDGFREKVREDWRRMMIESNKRKG